MSRPKTTLGFSLIELLVVIAIISILAAMIVSAASKAIGAAKKTSQGEGMRQRMIGNMADNVNSVDKRVASPPGRKKCRNAFHKWLGRKDDDRSPIVTELLYVVKNEKEFKAYYHTLINPSNKSKLELKGSNLVAKDASGDEFTLRTLQDWHHESSKAGKFPVMWQFLSRNMAETTLTDLNIRVTYAAGTTATVRYKSEYPATRYVADKALSLGGQEVDLHFCI